MSAQIISLSERRASRLEETPQPRPVRVSIPLVLPSLGWGWLMPVVCSVTVEW